MQRTIKAVSPIISILLIVAVVVAASLVAYAWIMGYIGKTTTTTGKAIQIQSYTRSSTYLVVYVQNVGQGQIKLSYPDNSVYVNDVPRTILEVNPQNMITDQKTRVTINNGETAALTINYNYTLGERLRIKIVTIEGTFIEIIIPGTEPTPNPSPNPSLNKCWDRTPSNYPPLLLSENGHSPVRRVPN